MQHFFSSSVALTLKIINYKGIKKNTHFTWQTHFLSCSSNIICIIEHPIRFIHLKTFFSNSLNFILSFDTILLNMVHILSLLNSSYIVQDVPCFFYTFLYIFLFFFPPDNFTHSKAVYTRRLYPRMRYSKIFSSRNLLNFCSACVKIPAGGEVVVARIHIL